MIDPRTEALNIEALGNLPTEGLLAMYADCAEVLNAWKVYQHTISKVVEQMMNDNEATVATTTIENPDGTTTNVSAEITTKIIYTEGIFHEAEEHLTPEDWESVLTVEKPKPARTVNATKFKKLAKRGKPFTTILDKASTTSDPFIKFSIK